MYLNKNGTENTQEMVDTSGAKTRYSIIHCGWWCNHDDIFV